MEKIIDAHCHVYPAAIAVRAAEAIGKFYDTPMVFDGRVETLLDEGGRAGISHFIISSVATTPHQVQAVNAFIAGQVAAYPGRLTGLGSLHPDSADIAGDIRRLREMGLAGVKLHPDMLGVPVDDPRFMKLFAACEGRLPVLCHFGDTRFDFTNPNRTAHVLKAFPNLTVIGAHFGGWSLWMDAVETLAPFENLLTDCSSSLFALSPERACAVIRAYGAKRVLFGTDFPMWKAADELARFNALALTNGERADILWNNAAGLFKIDKAR